MDRDLYFQELKDKIQKKETSICVVGLGYVGLPLAVALAKKVKVIGFDISYEKIEKLKKGIDPNNEIEIPSEIDILYTSNPEQIKNSKCYIIAVPTPVDKYNKPDLAPLLSASQYVSKYLKKGDVVVYESTVYPGCTREDCIPVLEKSGLKHLKDFFVGYSPERINPGDKSHMIENVTKVVSGDTPETANFLAWLYSLVNNNNIYIANSIEVAEASKILENTQRDINIALINEFTIIAHKLGISIYDVLDSAKTKWNFLPFTPGLVGGHCIAVDPYYLIHKAENLGYHTKLIYASRYINDTMHSFFIREIIDKLLESDSDITKKSILVFGITFKGNVSDIRNSRVVEFVREIKSFKISVDIYDPIANYDEVKKEYSLEIFSELPSNNKYDTFVLAVDHASFAQINEENLLPIAKKNAFIYDIKGLWRNKKFSKIRYYTL